MIIDKVQPYWTEEERNDLEEIQKERIEHIKTTRAKYENIEDAPQEELDYLPMLDGEAFRLITGVEARYIEDRKPEGLLEDVKEIVGAITQEDFLEYVKDRSLYVSALIGEEDNGGGFTLAELQEMTKEDYNNCYCFIAYQLRVQLDGLEDTPSLKEKAIAIVEGKVALWYVRPQPTHMPIPYSKPTSALAFLSQKRANIDAISGDATIALFDVRIRIEKLKELSGKLSPSTDKLFKASLLAFAQQNDFSKGSTTATNRNIFIPLREYAKLLGYDVEIHETSTPEEEKKEKKRVKMILDNVRRKTKKDMDILYRTSLDWSEKVGRKDEVFKQRRLLEGTDYKSGGFLLIFAPDIADHLVARGIMSQYNMGLFAIDERHPNAYRILYKLEEHYNMYANQEANRADRIGIPKILAVTDLPSYEEVQAHWKKRIFDPLMDNLAYLEDEGLLKGYQLTHAKGVPLTDDEAENIADYDTFCKLYLQFTPADKVDHTDRLERRREEREKRRKQAERKKQKKTTKNK